ncbi:hypothetical protein, partial [Gottfriedia acidiceleris]|uniref:hypothetical protein n=1 Tax=Gottfriedia acidiceleris TaxID=371036 RepID=UPI002FFF9529
NTDKKTHTVKLKAKKELIGPQYVDITAIVAGGHYVQGKTIKTFYTYPETKTSEHTLTKKEALADHFMIISGIGLIKFVGKKSPYKLALDLAAYVAGVTYTLKGLNVVSGYPTPSAGQYIRTTTSYSSNGMKLDIKMWSSKESYKKGVKPSYKYSQTHPWK